MDEFDLYFYEISKKKDSYTSKDTNIACIVLNKS